MVKSRRLKIAFYAAVAVGFIALNPLHLPFTLPWLAAQWEGNALGQLLSRHESTVLVVSTVYFMMASMAFWYWMWSKRPRRQQAPTTTASVSTNGVHPVGTPYRGPGGGKTRPRSHQRRRVRR